MNSAMDTLLIALCAAVLSAILVVGGIIAVVDWDGVKNRAVLDYRAYLAECERETVMTRDICDTVYDKMHGIKQGPL